MRVCNAKDIFAVAIKVEMDAGIDRRLHPPFNHIAVQIDDNHRIGCQLLELHA